jgi:transposase
MSRRTFSTEFKTESASLVLDQSYTIQDANRASGVGNTALRRWASQLERERQGITFASSRALTPDQQKI